MDLFKAWSVIHTCAASRSVILDIALDPSSQAFVRSFSHLVSRRVCPEHVIFDRGSNFLPTIQGNLQ